MWGDFGHSSVLVLTNQRPVLMSRDQNWPIRGQTWGHVTTCVWLKAVSEQESRSTRSLHRKWGAGNQTLAPLLSSTCENYWQHSQQYTCVQQNIDLENKTRNYLAQNDLREKRSKLSVSSAKKIFFFCRKKATVMWESAQHLMNWAKSAKSDLNSPSSLWYLKNHGENVSTLFVLTAHPLLYSFGFLDR